MQKVIDVRAILSKSGLGIEESASLLFPNHKRPYHALKRILDGIGELNAEEIARLSNITGIEVSLLFNPGIWKVTAGVSGEVSVLRMRSDQYFAELNLETLTTTVMPFRGKQFSSFKVSESTPIRAYLSLLTEFVNNN